MAIEVSKVNIVGSAAHPILSLYSHMIISSTINQLAKHLVTKFKIESEELINELENFEIRLPKMNMPSSPPTTTTENISLTIVEPTKRRGRPPKDPSKVSQPKEKIHVDAPDVSGVTDKNELDKYSANQLRAVLENNKLRITGSKQDLINRVWGISHPDEMPADALPKKRGRPKKGTSVSSGSTVSKEFHSLANGLRGSSGTEFNKVEDSEPESESQELDPDDLEEIWIKDLSVSTEGDGKKFLHHNKFHWVLSTEEDNPTEIAGFIGYLEGKKVNTTRKPPSIFA